ncbi:hypothetical protein GUITHDRAFT_142518 [Guillardia theta CCMP2712]|uniref:Uncharacterized protein n=1 Tax=Guillardia theta (strain CCMP2712) TaxID=905079 RepID=L1IWZ5_GUITC|nr:hypothetical protein GUITHDRAFT_142518 [Guillardia theta CCMP2712]EKX40637.1 hypothetical protein GUITHDRAFT_142518 [Guillardia theta CCMP2712]|eukprot:XP_005827617.1 hypothetical protein GUITHDRAFT_142518 [Guillardia theta CCMP2712]
MASSVYGSIPKNEPGPYEAVQKRGAPEWEAEAKRGFIIKVYSILSLQLAFTAACCAGAMFVTPVNSLMIGIGFWPLLVAMIGSFICLIALIYNKVIESWMVATICALYQAGGVGNIVLLAWATTFGIFAALTAFVFLTRWDFSGMWLFLFVGTIVMMVWGLCNMLFGFHASFVYGAFGALLMSGWIIYDTWQIMARLGPDDYILAVIDLYLDIINLFLFILDMFGRN